MEAEGAGGIGSCTGCVDGGSVGRGWVVSMSSSSSPSPVSLSDSDGYARWENHAGGGDSVPCSSGGSVLDVGSREELIGVVVLRGLWLAVVVSCCRCAWLSMVCCGLAEEE